MSEVGSGVGRAHRLAHGPGQDLGQTLMPMAGGQLDQLVERLGDEACGELGGRLCGRL